MTFLGLSQTFLSVVFVRLLQLCHSCIHPYHNKIICGVFGPHVAGIMRASLTMCPDLPVASQVWRAY